jgi:hypothetical protein
MATTLRGDDNFDSASPIPAGNFTAKAWATYELDGGTPSIIADGGISSITDLGVGEPQFNLDTALPAANGSCWNTPALYSNGAEYALQGGGYITATTHWKVYCGSSSTTQVDWDLGYSGLIR